MDALVEPRSQQPVRGDDVEVLQPGQSRQQIEIRREEAMRVGNPIADGHHHATERIGGAVSDEVRPQDVFVHESLRGQTLLVFAVRRRQETRLPQQPLGAAVAVGVKRLDEQLLISIDALPLSPQLIVEPHHFGDEARAQVKRRRRAGGNGLDGGGVENDLAFAGRQKGERLGQARVEEVVQLVARENGRRGGWTDIERQGKLPSPDAAPELTSAARCERTCARDDARRRGSERRRPSNQSDRDLRRLNTQGWPGEKRGGRGRGRAASGEV